MPPSVWSGREDLNLRPPRPERGALTGLRHSPKTVESIADALPYCQRPVPHSQDILSRSKPNDGKLHVAGSSPICHALPA